MDGVEASQGVALDQLSRLAGDRVGDVQADVCRPIVVQVGDGPPQLLRGEGPFSLLASESGASLRVGDGRGRDPLGFLDGPVYQFSAVLLLGVELYQRTGVKVNDQASSDGPRSRHPRPGFPLPRDWADSG